MVDHEAAEDFSLREQLQYDYKQRKVSLGSNSNRQRQRLSVRSRQNNFEQCQKGSESKS